MIPNQRPLFDLPSDVAYLNCAAMSPLMLELDEMGRKALELRKRPYLMSNEQWFGEGEQIRKSFAKLINCSEPLRVALIPAVSYGIATAAQNIDLKPGEEILVVAEQFPSNYFSWQRKAEESGGLLRVIQRPIGNSEVGKRWNTAILEAISERTKVVAIGNIHWTDGTLFDLEEIGKAVRKHGGLLIVDGSQTVGAFPFDLEKVKPDALFCVGYKWLLGPYGVALGYFGPAFDKGRPLEENWINRAGSEDFANLVNGSPSYRPFAGRYNVGEQSQLHLLPILNGSLAKILDWGVPNIQAHCQEISGDAIVRLRKIGCVIEDEAYRVPHLFGIRFPKHVDVAELHAALVNEKIYASLRGDALRISLHLYTDSGDLERLCQTLERLVS